MIMSVKLSPNWKFKLQVYLNKKIVEIASRLYFIPINKIQTFQIIYTKIGIVNAKK